MGISQILEWRLWASLRTPEAVLGNHIRSNSAMTSLRAVTVRPSLRPVDTALTIPEKKNSSSNLVMC